MRTPLALNFCFLIFSINPRGLGVSPNPHPSISPHRWALGAGGHRGHPGTHLPHHASVCLVFYSPHPPLCIHPSCLSIAPPGVTRPRSKGDPPSRQPIHCARDTRTGRAPGWRVGGHTRIGGAQGLGGHQEGAESHNPPSALCILAGIGTLWRWHRVPLLPPHDQPQPFAQQCFI